MPRGDLDVPLTAVIVERPASATQTFAAVPTVGNHVKIVCMYETITMILMIPMTKQVQKKIL